MYYSDINTDVLIEQYSTFIIMEKINCLPNLLRLYWKIFEMEQFNGFKIFDES